MQPRSRLTSQYRDPTAATCFQLHDHEHDLNFRALPQDIFASETLGYVFFDCTPRLTTVG